MIRPSRLRRRSGQTMLELIAATTIISVALVPALRVTRDQVHSMRELELAEMRLALCTSKMEEELAQTAANWQLADSNGNFAATGYPEIRYSVRKSDALSAGGVPGSLAAIRVIVWDDRDLGGDIDGDEASAELATKIAKMATYEHKATGP